MKSSEIDDIVTHTRAYTQLDFHISGVTQPKTKPNPNPNPTNPNRHRRRHFYRAMLCIRGTSPGPVSVCLFVCPLQVGVLSKRMNESSWFCRVSFLPPVLHCVKRKFGYLQNKGTSLWNFFLNSRLGKFRHGISIVVTCYQLSSRKVDAQSVINWAILPSSDARPL